MAGLLPDLLGPDGLPSAMTEGGLTYTADRLGSSSSAPYYHYPAPSDNISNPQPYPAPERIDQVLSYMQKVRPGSCCSITAAGHCSELD